MKWTEMVVLMSAEMYFMEQEERYILFIIE
jgi:hypothetical protein